MVFDYLVVPKTTGTFTLPPIELVYFDVNSKSYKTVRTQPVTMNVAKGKKSNELDEQLQLRQRDIFDIQKEIKQIIIQEVGGKLVLHVASYSDSCYICCRVRIVAAL